jgi:cellulose synthase/poly-beta-1,6-N-acetylglucosamine synthase-like glycosyltransferase
MSHDMKWPHLPARNTNPSMRFTVCICTSMKRDLRVLIEALLHTTCDELLVVGNRGAAFPVAEFEMDSRVRWLEADADLANKRNVALRQGIGEVVAFIDDDAMPSDTWYEAMSRGFNDPAVGVVTGPSILPKNSTLWFRTAQLAMMSTQYSRSRYSYSRRGYAAWWAVIGANVGFRKDALLQEGGCEPEFSAQADEMIMAYKMESRGWKIWYDPDAFVYHSPHPPLKQITQVYKWGRGAVQLGRSGVRYPSKDPAYILFVPLYVAFCFVYLAGMFKEMIAPERKV